MARALARIAIAAPAILTLAGAVRADAQLPRDTVAPPAITSMGQPPLWQPYTSLIAAFGRTNDTSGPSPPRAYIRMGASGPKASAICLVLRRQ